MVFLNCFRVKNFRSMGNLRGKDNLLYEIYGILDH